MAKIKHSKILLIFTLQIAVLCLTVEGGYLGCYREKAGLRLFNKNPGALGKSLLTPQTCYTLCGGQGFDYAALGMGKFCFCSHVSPNGILVEDSPDTKCTLPCPGDSGQKCGSAAYVNVYKTPVAVTHTIDAMPKIVEAGNTVILTPQVEPSGLGFDLRIDYNNLAGTTEYAENGTGIVNHIYAKAGEYEILSYVTDTGNLLPDSETAVSVVVESSPVNVTVQCPDNMATFDEDVCIIRVSRGTNAQLLISYTDGNPGTLKTDSFQISDAMEYSMGNFVRQHFLTSAPSSGISTGGVIIHHGYPAQSSGYLVAVEYYGVGSGTISLHVYRPSCAGEYCYETNTCEITCDASCGGNYCMEIDSCCGSPPTRSTDLLASYTLTHTLSVAISPGYGHVDLTPTYDVMLGDVIAHDGQLSPLIASSAPDVPAGTLYDYYCAGQVAPNTVGIGICTLTTEVHQLRAIYAETSEVIYPLEFSSPGNVTIEATVYNLDQANIPGNETGTYDIAVWEGVNATIIIAPEYFAADNPTEINVETYTGSPATVDWDLGNGQQSAINLNTIYHTYTAIGPYNITVNVSNAVSYKFNITSIIVEETITGLSINSPAVSTVEVDALTTIDVGMTTGSDYVCDFELIYDGGNTLTFQKTELEGLNFDYTFTTIGALTLNVTCSNHLGSASTSMVLQAVEPLTNVALSPPGAVAEEEFYFLLTWSTGSDVTLDSFTYDGTAVTDMTVNNNLRQATTSIPRTETTTGIHTVSYALHNPLGSVSVLSTDFVIEIEMQNVIISTTFPSEMPSASSDYIIIPLNTDVQVEVDMTAGTSVKLEIVYDDGDSFSQSAGTGMTWATVKPAFGFPIVHTFITAAYYQMTVTVSNSFSSVVRTYPIAVMVGVDNTEIDSVVPVKFGPPALVNFTFSSPSPVPNDVQCYIEWGDGNYDEIYPCDLLDVFPHEYLDADGKLELKYKLQNLVSSKEGTLPVYIVTPIIDNECNVGKTAGIPGVPLDLVFKAWRCPPPGPEVNLTFVCDTANPGNMIQRPRTEESPDGEDKESCTYTSTGTYTMSIQAESRMETKTCTHTFKILHPVTDDYDVIIPAVPMDKGSNVNCQYDYSIVYNGVPFPQEATLEIDFGDDSPLLNTPFTTTTYSNSYNYAQAGHYITKIRIFNDASESIKHILTGCYEDFSAVSITAMRLPELPVDSPPVLGFGASNNIFIGNEDLGIYPSFTKGTLVWYEVSLVCNNSIINCNQTDKDQITLSIPETESGGCTITVEAKNPVHKAAPVIYDMEIMQPVKNITVESFFQSRALQDKNFTVTMASYGTKMCVAVDFGVTNEKIELFGDDDTCTDKTLAISHFGSSMFKNGVQTSVSQSFSLTHMYPDEGTYTLDIFAWNYISSGYGELQFAVSSLDCSAPNIDIRERERDFRNANASSFYRSKRCKITGITDIRCPNTLRNTKRWTAFEVNEKTGEIVSELNITSVESSINSELAFDPLYLPYGTYLLIYKVTMLTPSVEKREFSSKAETYIKIIPSPLISVIFNGSISMKTVGPNSLLTFNPKTFSKDPDVDEDNGDENVFDSILMACRDKTLNESFPNTSVEVVPRNLSDLLPGHIDTGGCFQTGPGWFKYFNGYISFWSDILKPEHAYEFKLIVRKDGRESTSLAQVYVETADPPQFEMSFMIPKILKSSPDGKKFNPNMQLGMYANLLVPCPSCTYLWELFAYDYQFCGPIFECWRNLTYLGRYIEGVRSDQLTVRTQVFEHYKKVDIFQLRLEVKDESTGITGRQIMNLTRNHPPSNGNCTISPNNGTTMHTNFTIECNDFIDEDDDDIESYVITCLTSDGDRIVLEDTFPYWDDRYLPMGVVEEGGVLRCNVTVTDDLGSSGTYPQQDVTVEKMSYEEFKQMIFDLKDSDSDVAELIMAVSNLGQTSTFVSAVSSMLQDLSTNDEYEVVNGCGTILSYRSSGLYSNESRPSAFTKTVVNETVTKQYEVLRDAATNLTQTMITALNYSTAESPTETNQLTATVSTLSKSLSMQTRSTQTAMTDLLNKGLNNVLKHEDDMSIEQMQSITQNTMDACANIGESAALTADHPTITDEDTQNETVKYFDTSMDSTLPDVEMQPNDAAALKNGKRILNKKVQTGFSQENFLKCTNIQEKLLERLSAKLPNSPDPVIMETSSSATHLFKNDALSLTNTTISTAGVTIDIPSGILPDSEMENTVIFSIVVNAAPSLVLEEDSPAKKTSRTVKIGYKDENGNPIKIKNIDPPLKVKIPRDPNAPKTNISELPLENPEIIATRYDEIFFYHKTKVVNKGAALKLIFRPTNISDNVQLLVVTNFDKKPELNPSLSEVKYACTIPSDTSLTGQYGSDSEVDPYSCFIPSSVISDNNGWYHIGVRQLDGTELNTIKSKDDLPGTIPEDWKRNKAFTTDYRFYPGEITCVYNDDDDVTLRHDGVEPSPLSSVKEIQCITTHLTTFAGGWAVAPNTIDWNFIFSNADFFKNPTLYITEIVIALVYIIAMIWARRKDRQDLEKLGLAPLLDNDPRDKYYYEIMVSTGMRRGAGTESKVHFILSGEEEETDVRTFEDKKRKIFTRGSTDGFLMSVPEPIGALNYLRIWHDNSGKGRTASWYLNHVIVRDVQTDKKYYFIANRWFAVEEDDGQVDRVIPVAGKEQMTEFSHLFAERATKNLSDGHLWFSVVARPPQSRFTRCQRVSCCLCLLYTSMLANAMFYGTETSDSNAFQFGPFALTSEQIFIGVVCNLLIFPVNFLLITLFRKSRPRKLRPSRVEEAIRSKPERTTSMADVNPRVKSSLDYERPGSSFLMDTKRSQSSMSRTESPMSAANVPTTKKQKKKCELPWWFVIVSWILLWIAVLVSAAFVTFYGIMFQDIKCKKWITSMLISFFTSVFFTQPIKVFLFAIIFSLIIKNPGGDEEQDDDEEAPKKLETDEELLHEEEDEFGFVTPRKPMYKPKPPDTKALEVARKQRLKEIQMWSVIREILFYAFFLWILLVISYRNVSTNSYNYKHNMQKVFILTNDTNKAFSKVKNTYDFWTWAKSGMLRGLRAGPYYNDFPPFYMRGYINDKQSRLMGYAILRQSRITPDSCKLPRVVEGVIDECNGAYDIAEEEDRDFGVGWTSMPVNSSRYEYKYSTGSSLNSYPYWGEMSLYGGGGYVVRLNQAYEDMIAHFDQLQTEGWVDKYTRAVFLEFTVYNPSINLFSVSTLLAEFLPNGGVFTSFRFEPCNLLPYMNSALLFQIICEIVYFLFAVFFVFSEIKNIVKQKKQYFLQFWNLVDLAICAMSVTAIVIYFYRLFCINRLTEYFNETNGNEYMKFQYVGYWSEIFNYIIGFLVYFATLKFLKLLRFNKKISMLSDTLRNSSKDLIHFSIIFNVVFLAFIQVFYLVFMAHLDTFKTFHRSMEAGIVMMMGKFDIYNMLGVNQWLTQIFIFLFVVTVTFIVVNMLLSILNDTFSAVRNDKAKQENDYEIVDFMLGRFKTWTGIGRDNTTISPSEMDERNKNYRTLEGQIDYFPDQIDRFLASVSNMYMGDEKFEAFLQKGMAKKMAMKAQSQNDPESHPPPRFPGALRISNGARGMTDVQTD